jgi:translation initiation factor 4A
MVAVVVNRYRESSIQYREEVRALGDKLSVTSHACVGGLPPAIDRKALGAGIQVVFGTPGRLQDLFEHVVWDISNVKILVLEFDDAKDVEVWHDQLTYLCAKLPKAQLCVVAENKEVIDKLSLLFRRELDNIDFMKR